jgi:hypothetical protein
MNERPHWRVLNDGEEPPAGRYARDLGDGRRAWYDDLDDEADDCPAITITFFPDAGAATKREQALDLTDLARRIEITTGPDKAHLPWLKCARFGDIRTDKASLRWDGNLLAITGIEGDYDGEEISFETACDVMRRGGVASIVYTSPSHTEDTPRWRVLCPLSEEYPPDCRDAFLARLNGLFGGIFSRESWTRSQSYYFGSVNSNPSHRVAVLAGKPIDQAVELDSIAINKPVKPEASTRPVHPAADPSKITDKRVNGKIESLLDNIRAAQDQQKHHTLWDNALAIGGYLHLTDWTDEQAVEECIAALPSAKDWNLARRTAAEAIAKGRLKPLHLEERPLPPRRTGNGPAPPPPPDAPEQIPEPEQELDGEAELEGPAESAAGRELYGPPTLGDLDVADLAALDELVYGQIAKAKAALLGVTPTVLTKLVERARTAPKAAAKAAKAKAEADAKMAKVEARLREKLAKQKEREAKATEARARLVAQKTPPPLVDDDDDPLRDWIPPDPNTLPEIIVAGGERPAIADAALAAMKVAAVPFYQRGKDLVRVCLIRLKQSNGKMVRVPAISTVTKPMLLRAMGLCAKWLTLNKELDLVQIDPPSDLGDHILGMIGEWPFPPLRGVIATQTMRYDGTLLTKPGYDPATGLVLFNPPPLPEIPDQPTKADALEALALLNGLLAEVKFAEDNNVSRSCAMSMLMTPPLRGMMPVAPLHMLNKPAPGTGGSYMQDIMAAIAIGEPCPVISLTLNNDEENEKRLSSAATSGQPIIAIDNMVGTLMGQFLCQLVERPMPQVRILGKTELVTIPNNHTTVANGNNVAIAADMVRRTLQISLDADEENPESRTFTRNPVAEVLADRGRYIAAILTIARAYRVAGMPEKLPQRLSFGEWSDNVRSALKWLGWPDCDDSIKTVRAADPAGAELHGVIIAWAADLAVSVGYRTSELLKEADAFVYDGLGGGTHAKPDLRDALFNVAGGKNGQLDARVLGRWLEAHLNRVSGGYKLLVDRSDTSRPRWRLEPR